MDAEPPRNMELVATSKVPIISMVVFKDRLFVATSEGVFERGDDGAFHEMQFVPRNAVATERQTAPLAVYAPHISLDDRNSNGAVVSVRTVLPRNIMDGVAPAERSALPLREGGDHERRRLQMTTYRPASRQTRSVA